MYRIAICIFVWEMFIQVLFLFLSGLAFCCWGFLFFFKIYLQKKGVFEFPSIESFLKCLRQLGLGQIDANRREVPRHMTRNLSYLYSHDSCSSIHNSADMEFTHFPLTDARLMKIHSVFTVEYYVTIKKKNENLFCSKVDATENHLPCKINQTSKDTHPVLSYVGVNIECQKIRH